MDSPESVLPKKRPQSPIEIWRRAQVCLAALEVDRAWRTVRNALKTATDGVLLHISRTQLFDGRMPSTHLLVLTCNRRRSAIELSAAGSAIPASLEIIPADVLAMHAQRKLETRNDLTSNAAALSAAMNLWEHFKQLDNEARHAPSRMDELRRRKGIA